MYHESDPKNHGAVDGPLNHSILPLGAEGAPIVDAARGLRARKEGRVALSDNVSHPEAQALLDEIYRQRPKPKSTS